jgi:hypothetical protein
MVVNLWNLWHFLAFYLIWRKQIETVEKAFAEIESAGTNFSAGSSACFAQKCRPVSFGKKLSFYRSADYFHPKKKGKIISRPFVIRNIPIISEENMLSSSPPGGTCSLFQLPNALRVPPGGLAVLRVT